MATCICVCCNNEFAASQSHIFTQQISFTGSESSFSGMHFWDMRVQTCVFKRALYTALPYKYGKCIIVIMNI